MRTKALILALAAAWMFGGCSAVEQPRDGMLPAGCDGPAHVCRVTISVSGCGTGTITANPDVRVMPRGTWVIQWELQPGYDWANDGISFKNDPGGIFTGGRKNGNKFQWVDNNRQKGGPYYYNVRVLKDGKACAHYDPEISND